MARADAFSRTCKQIVTIALRRLGKVAAGSLPRPDQMADGIEVLNLVVARLPKATRLWTRSEGTETCVIGQAYVELDANVVDIQHLKVRISGDDEDIVMLDRIEWTDIGTKSESGQPTKAYVNRGVDPIRVQLHPVPDVAYVLVFDQIRRLYKFDSQNDTPDFPAHWIDALAAAVAASMAPEYRASIEDRRDLRSEARRLLSECNLLDRDSCDTTFVRSAF